MLRCILLTTALFLAACSADEPEESAPRPSGPPPAKVEVFTIEETSMVAPRTFLGEVRNAGSTLLAAGGSGNVTRVSVNEGDAVKRGQVLVQLDDAILRARLRELKADLERTNVDLDQATRDAERFSSLSEKGFAAGREAEQTLSRKASLQVSAQGQEAALERLREEIAQMRVVAPVDGVVARRHVSRGQWLTTGEPAIELASEGSLEVHVRVPSEVLDVLHDDSAVEVVRREDRVAASVAGVVGSLDPRTRTALLRVLADEPRPWLREGDAVDVVIALERRTDGVVVPTDALVYGVSGARVFRVTDGKAEPHDVSIVARSQDSALVAAPNLAKGDSIVRRGNERLRPGQPLEVQQ